MLEVFTYLVEPQRVGLNVVAASISLLAAYTAFSLAVKPAPAERIRHPWLLAAGVAYGSGAWAVTLIVLLGYHTDVPFAFNLLPMVLALIVGIVGSYFGIYLARRNDQMQTGGTIVGLAIAGMFYTGMMGVEFSGTKSWDSLYVVVSVLLGASFGAAALARGNLSPDLRGRLISALMLAISIMSVNLVGLSALTVTADPNIIVPDGTALPVLFGISLTAVVMLIIGLGIVGALVDRYVGEIECAKDLLEARVIERTEQLSVAMERVESAARAKGVFLASMSHELRTPLNAILGFSEMISQAVTGPIDQRYREYGAEINSSGKHLLSLVNDILDLSKLESGKFELHEEQVGIAGVLDACRSMVVGLAHEAGVNLTINSNPQMALVWADPVRIKQIVVNLLSNAIKFTEAGGQVIASAGMDADGNAVIEVRDNGIGMSPEGIEKALEPFGQVDNPLNRRHGGTGLGIPVVKRFVELHGGTLRISSKLGEGTSITFSLSTVKTMPEVMAS